MATGYYNSAGTDIGTLFVSGTGTQTFGYKNSSGSDLGALFKPSTAGSPGVTTGYKASDGNDIGPKLCKIGTDCNYVYDSNGGAHVDTEVVDNGSYTFCSAYAYNQASVSGSLNFKKLSSISTLSYMYSAFGICSRITAVSFPALTSIGSYGLQLAFGGCTALVSVSFPALTTIGGGGAAGVFMMCISLTTVSFPALTSIGFMGMGTAFANCTNLTSVFFPALTSIGSYGINAAFNSCSKATIHFKASMSTNTAFVTEVNQCGMSSKVVWDL